MLLYSTKNRHLTADLREAVLKGLPSDNGLFMPFSIPSLPNAIIKNLDKYSFKEIALAITSHLFNDFIPQESLEKIVNQSINFPAPVVRLSEELSILELFHGPSLAFKDFGARFMAQLMSYFNKNEENELVILVATSGDTGGAVAAGFHNTAGIKVVILYPSGKVSPLQEKQLTTLGGNIHALEINGTFDDCQSLVKKAFLDPDLTNKIRLSSANSINIGRLIPQSFYYFEAYKQVMKHGKKVVFSVPSGNFGNLTAGLMAKKMGLPVHHFIAATNINDIVPTYLSNKIYNPKASIPTISNAMDVGNPSNFARMVDLFRAEEQQPGDPNDGSTWNNMREYMNGYAFDDTQTRAAIQKVYNDHSYIIDPHGAVGYLAFQEYSTGKNDLMGIILETAHPSKFKKEVENILGKEKIVIPKRLAILSERKKEATLMEKDYPGFKTWLMNNY